LHAVKYVDENNVFAVGDGGVLLKGCAKGFQVIPTGTNDSLRGLEWFNQKLYIGAARQGLFVWDGERVSKVTTTPKSEFECHTLSARDGKCWL